MHAILHGEPRMLDVNKAELPLDLQRILGKALSKAPKDRYQTVTELATELSVFKRNFELGKIVPAVTKSKLILARLKSTSRADQIDYAKDLNDSQFKAVMTTGGPLLIVAGAGTGKTRTLVYRVAVVESEPPE